MSVDATIADWLRSPGLRITATNAGAAAWGDLAVTSEVRTPFEAEADAVAEGARQIAFLGPPRVIETLSVSGRQGALRGKAITITADLEGYRSGAVVFVIGTDEASIPGRTILRVIRRLV